VVPGEGADQSAEVFVLGFEDLSLHSAVLAASADGWPAEGMSCSRGEPP
jgi:hypothetical protein